MKTDGKPAAPELMRLGPQMTRTASLTTRASPKVNSRKALPPAHRGGAGCANSKPRQQRQQRRARHASQKFPSLATE